MTIAYTWQFDSLDVYPTYETVTDAVESMHWTLTADDGLGHQAQAFGEQKTGPIDVNNFIPYASLTFNDVFGWLQEKMGALQMSAYENLLAIQMQPVPITQSLPVPW